MNRLGQLIYTSDWGHEVYAVIMRDKNSKRVSVELYTVSDKGEMSDIITLARKDIFTKKNCFDFFYDLDGDFTRDNIDHIKIAVVEMLRNDSAVEDIQGRATIKEIHSSLSDYIREKSAEDSETIIFIKDGYGYMRTPCMEEFIKKYKELGYKRIEILKRLKIAGVLQNGKDRPYDKLVSIDGEKKHYYKILLAEKKEDESEEDEVVSL